MKLLTKAFLLTSVFSIMSLNINNSIAQEFADTTFKAGHESLQQWILPSMPEPSDNAITPARVKLGKALFFDPRLSGDKNMSCASCHNPSLGWADALPKGKGKNSQLLSRATPSIINTGYNTIQTWDGRNKNLEEQAIGPMEAKVEMHTDIDQLLRFLSDNPQYTEMFSRAYPNMQINIDTLTKALATFQRTVVSNNSSFDQWIKGDSDAMTAQQVNGFKLFMNPNKGKCAVCHSAPNFTDDGFHNLGLASFGDEDPDLGRFSERPLRMMKGAFKTPTLRDISLTAPYFHDGSADNLTDVIVHYVNGGVVKTNLSPNFLAAELNDDETADMLAFLKTLTTRHEPFSVPNLPVEE